MFFHTLNDTLLVLLYALTLALSLEMLAAFVPVLGLVFGWPGRSMGMGLGWLRTKLNRPNRTQATLLVRGVILTLLLLAGAAALGWAGMRLSAMDQGGSFVEIILMGFLFGAGNVLQAAHSLRRGLVDEKSLTVLEPLIHSVVRRDALLHDRAGLVRAMIEALADASIASLTAPVLAYLLLGLPGAFVVRLFALQARQWNAPRAAGARDFSAAARSAWAGLAVFPAMLACLWVTLAALLVPGAYGGKALAQCWLRAATRHGILAVYGAAVDVSLAGPRLGDEAHGWLGGSTARPGLAQLRTALRLFWMVRGLMFVALGLSWIALVN